MTVRVKAQSVGQPVSTGGSLISDAKLRQLYTAMVHCRLLADYAAGLRSKMLSVRPYEASTGQEAITAGWVIDLEPGDSVALAPGDSIASLIKGVPLPELVAPLFRVPDAAVHAVNGDRRIIPASSTLEEQSVVIISAAFANKRKKKRSVVVSFTNAPVAATGAWQRMVSTAAQKKLPIVFVVENNPWTVADASGVMEADDFALKARGFGLTGISVDGNDVVAVYRVAYESLDRVRHGDGPVMVEAKTYAASGRGKSRIERDPLIHMERYLKAKKLFSAKWKDQLIVEFTGELKRAAKAARKLSA